MRALLTFLSLAVALPLFADIATGDRHYGNRAVGAEGANASATEIDLAIAQYEDAWKADPQSLEAMWKLAQALRFKLVHAVRPPYIASSHPLVKRAGVVLDQGYKVIAEKIRSLAGGDVEVVRQTYLGDRILNAKELEQFASAIRTMPDAQQLMYQDVRWHLAQPWTREMRALGMAVALVASGADMDDDGPTRALGVLIYRSGNAVKVEGETKGLGTTEDGLRYLRENVQRFPGNPQARMYLAVTLRDQSVREFSADGWEGKSSEVVRLLRTVADMKPRAENLVEDEDCREHAEELLYNRRARFRFAY